MEIIVRIPASSPVLFNGGVERITPKTLKWVVRAHHEEDKETFVWFIGFQLFVEEATSVYQCMICSTGRTEYLAKRTRR